MRLSEVFVLFRKSTSLSLPRLVKPVVLIALLVVAICRPQLGVAHPISLTSTEIQVGERSLVVQVEVLLEDLTFFHSIEPGAENYYSASDLRDAAIRHEEVLLEALVLIDGDGTRLAGRATGVDIAKLTQDVAQERLMQERLNYRFSYSWAPSSDYLTVVHRLGDNQIGVPSIMDLSIRRGETWIHRPSQLMSGQALTIPLNSKLQARLGETQWEVLKREKERAAQKRLGISSYSALYSFIYVNGQRLRHELLVPLLTFEQWLPLARRDPMRLTVDEQREAEPAINDFFRERAPIWMNGNLIDPKLERIQFFGVDLNDFALNAEARDVSVYQARLGVILEYNAGEPLAEVEVPWMIEDQSTATVQSQIYVEREPPQAFRFWKGNPRWQWRASDEKAPESLGIRLEPPKASSIVIPFWSAGLLLGTLGFVLGCRVAPDRRTLFGRASIGCALGAVLAYWAPGYTVYVPGSNVEEYFTVEAREIAGEVLARCYKAFEVEPEGRAYDVLSDVVRGELLERLYLQLQRGLVLREQGGALAEVEALDFYDWEMESFEVVDDGRYHVWFVGRWAVTGRVEHWGHVHRRKQSYSARIRVYGELSGWKIDEMEILSEERFPIESEVRR